MVEKYLLTLKGVAEKEERLDYLIKVKRSEMAEQVKIAREHGDISENAEYDAAKNAQGEVEDEIKTLENMLAKAQIIEADEDTSTVDIGDYVTIKDLELGNVEEYHLVGSAEAEFIKKRISNESPLGSALIGKSINEIVTISAPRGKFQYEILNIRDKK